MRTLEIALIGCLFLAAGCSPDDGIDPGTGVIAEGRWVGDLQSGYLPSGSSLVVLEIDHARVGETVVARVVFGEGAAPSPPPTDPEVGWPTEIDPQMGSVPVADGFVYASRGGTRTGDQVRIDLAVTDLWAPWCALQTPYQIAAGSDEAQCLPNRPWTATPFDCHLDEDATDPELSVDCLKLALCRRTRVCACTGTDGCSPSRTGLTMVLDLFVTGDTAEATILWTSEDRDVGNQSARVHLTRG